jgi:hypothetical protein
VYRVYGKIVLKNYIQNFIKNCKKKDIWVFTIIFFYI